MGMCFMQCLWISLFVRAAEMQTLFSSCLPWIVNLQWAGFWFSHIFEDFVCMCVLCSEGARWVVVVGWTSFRSRACRNNRQVSKLQFPMKFLHAILLLQMCAIFFCFQWWGKKWRRASVCLFRFWVSKNSSKIFSSGERQREAVKALSHLHSKDWVERIGFCCCRVTCNSARFSDDGSKLAVITPDAVTVYACDTGKEVLKLLIAGVAAIAFSPQGSYLQTFQKPQAQQRNLTIWNALSGAIVLQQFQKSISKTTW